MFNIKRTQYRGDGNGKMWPLSRTGTAPTIKSVFGPRVFSSHLATVGYDYDFHRGVDAEASIGDAVYSPISGSISRAHWTHFGWEIDAQLLRWEETDAASSLILERQITDVLRMTCSRVGAQVFPTNVAMYSPKEERVQIQEGDWAIEIEFDTAPSLAAGAVGICLINSSADEYVALEYDGTTFTIRGADSSGLLTSHGDTTAVASQTWMRITYTKDTDTIEWLYGTDGESWTSLGTEATHLFTDSLLPVFKPGLYWLSGDSNITPYVVGVARLDWQDAQTVQRFGNWIEITNGDERFVLIHFRDFAFEQKWVQAGELIGYVGATGFDNRSGRVVYPHLHLEYIEDNGFFYDNSDPTNPLGASVMPRTNVSNNVSVLRTDEEDPDGYNSIKLEITVTRADQDFDLNSISLTGTLDTRTINFNTRAGLNVDSDVPIESGVYLVANDFDENSESYILDAYFNTSVVGAFYYFVISDTDGNVLYEENTLFALDFAPSIANLPRTVTLNGETQLPSVFVRGDGSGGVTTEYGATFTEQGSGTSPTDAGDFHPFFQTTDAATVYNDGTHHGSPNTTDGSVGSGDHVFELTFRMNAAGSGGTIFGKLNGSGEGWQIAATVGSSVRIYYKDASANTTNYSATVLPGYNHLLVVANADSANGCRIYLNGAYLSALTLTTLGSLDQAVGCAVGSNYAGAAAAFTYNDAIASAGVWTFADLGTSATEQDAFAAERFARLTGTYATFAAGQATPTIMTRASAKHIWKDDASGNRIGVQVGAGWPDICRIGDVAGYRGENAAINFVPYATELENVAWGLGECTVAVDTEVSVLGGLRRKLTGSTLSNIHAVNDVVHVEAGQSCYSIIAEAGTEGYVLLQMTGGAAGTQANIWDLATGALTYEQNPNDSNGAKYLGNGRWQFWFVTTDTDGARTLYAGLSGGDGTEKYVSAPGYIYIHHIQVEAGAYPTSPIYTSGGPASRVIDILKYSSTGNVNESNIDVRADVVSVIPGRYTTGYRYLAEVFLSSDNRFTCVADADKARLGITDGGVPQATIVSTTSITDGTTHAVRFTAKTNDARLYIGGVIEASDASVSMPSGMDTIVMKLYGGDTNPSPDLVISNFRIIYKA